ncbi:MAG: NAD(P)/FAD-dependent oxidoreductase [Patescibacteria group bacterium]
MIVIGGGPAGLMAAGRAAECGARVLLLEKNSAAGRKLLMTGNGRCNLTQKEDNVRELVKKYHNGAFLFSAFHAFGPRRVIEFFEECGVRTKEEELQRVFPISNKAIDVLNALLDYLKAGKVTIKYNAIVKRIESKNGRIDAVILADGTKLNAKKVILSTGGQSYPSTGSTGDGWKWLRDLGHTVVEPKPALVPLKVKETWVKELKGVSLQNVDVKVIKNKKTIAKTNGDFIFTHFGVSGPAILTVSREAVAALAGDCRAPSDYARNDKKGMDVSLQIDLLPETTIEKLDRHLSASSKEFAAKSAKHVLDGLASSRLAEALIELAKIDPRKQCGQITKVERQTLVSLMKSMTLTVIGSLGFEVAMVTSGGVDVKEVDPKTMQSKLIDNLFFAGEVLDVDGPTGGYNLQMCWSTGFAAGSSV